MKYSNSNPTGWIFSSVLMVIGAGTIISYFAKKTNQKKVNEAGKYLFKKLKEEGRTLKNKAKNKIDSSKLVLEDMSNGNANR